MPVDEGVAEVVQQGDAPRWQDQAPVGCLRAAGAVSSDSRERIIGRSRSRSVDRRATKVAAPTTESPPARAPAKPSARTAATRAAAEAQTPTKPRSHRVFHRADVLWRGFP